MKIEDQKNKNEKIIDPKIIKKIIWTISTTTIFFTSIPLIFYFMKFHHGLSNSKADWGTFGDFIGGIVGTLFSLIAVFFSIISVYITLKISMRIHSNEQELNRQNSIRETERFQKEIELITKQNKPFLYLDLSNYATCVKVNVMNQGTGTLIIDKTEYNYNGKTYDELGHLIIENTTKLNYVDDISFFVNSAKNHVIAPGTQKMFLTVEPIGDPTENFITFFRELRDCLSKTTLTFTCQDIFENEFIYEDGLAFLHN